MPSTPNQNKSLSGIEKRLLMSTPPEEHAAPAGRILPSMSPTKAEAMLRELAKSGYVASIGSLWYITDAGKEVISHE